MDAGSSPGALALSSCFVQVGSGRCSMAGVDASLGGGEEACLVAPSHKIPIPFRAQALMGDLLGHLRELGGWGQGAGTAPGKTGVQVGVTAGHQGFRCCSASHGPLPLGSHGTSQRLSVLLCGMGTMKPANLID